MPLKNAVRNAAQAPTALSPSGAPPYVQQVEPAVVGIQAAVPLDRPSVLTLGPVRLGSGVIFDPAGYILTGSYPFNDGEHAPGSQAGSGTPKSPVYHRARGRPQACSGRVTVNVLPAPGVL